MSKFRSIILIIGLLVIAVAAALLTVLVLYATGTIKTDPIELVYSLEDVEKDYDGTPLTLTDADYVLESGEILEGHTAQVKIIGSQTNAGTSESTLEVKIFDKKGFDVSDEYAVKVNTGTLTVKQRDLSVYIEGGQEVFYNGKEVFFNDYRIEGDVKLVKGHRIAGTNDSIINIGTLPLDVKPVIYDAFDNDVTENYNIDFSAGEVKVVPRPLTLKPKNVSKVYDGTALEATEYEITDGSLAPGQKVSYDIIFSTGGRASEVDCVDTRIKIDPFTFQIFTEDGDEVDLKNYEYTLNAGTFKIEQRPVTVATATQAFTYDGEEHFDETIRIFSGSLAPNQIISVTEHATVTDVDEGEVPNALTFAIAWKDGPAVNAGNYVITPITGTLSVKPYNLTVYTKSYTKEYDGEPLSNRMDGDNYELDVALSDKFTITAECDNAVKDQVKVIAETSYKLKNVSVTVSGEDGDKDCTNNFNVNVREGKYSITQKPATITSATKSFEYDTEEHYDVENYKTVGLLNGHDIDITDYTKVTDVEGNIPNLYEYSIKDKQGADVTGNYKITFIAGVLTVTPKKVDIALSEELQKEYSGEVYEFDKDEVFAGANLDEYDGLSAADFDIVIYSEIKNAGKYKYTAKFTGESQNYDISIGTGEVEITRKDVDLVFDLPVVQMTYGGYENYYSDYDYLTDHLTVDEHKVRTALFSHPDNDLKHIFVEKVTVYDDVEGDLTKNYNINCAAIVINVFVKRCAITLVLPEYTDDYYYSELIAAGVSANGLAAGDTLVVTDISNDGYSLYQVTAWEVWHGNINVTEYYTVTNPDETGKYFISKN